VSHQFLRFTRSSDDTVLVREISRFLLNSYFGVQRSRTAWKKQLPTVFPWHRQKHGPNGEVVGIENFQSVPLLIETVDEMLEKKRTFDFDALKLFDPMTVWLDQELHVAIDFHAIGIKTASSIGGTFPYEGLLDREGASFLSFQSVILRRIASVRKELVTSSEIFAKVEWFQSLRTLVSECVSLIDGLLHQLYWRAECNPQPGWKFEPAKLGPRHGQRLADKLNWVPRITGKLLHTKEETAAFVQLKEIRNHLQHFDPPVFCFTLEDVTRWLNLVPSVARLNWEIRKCMGATLSVPLIEVLLGEKVEFVPKDPSRPRTPQGPNSGYASTSKPKP